MWSKRLAWYQYTGLVQKEMPERATPSTAAAAANQNIYDRLHRGQLDYWRFMAAPRFRAETIVEVLEERQPERVADLGCGTGLLLQRVADRLPAAERVGIDLAGRQIEVARAADPDTNWHVVDLDSPSPRLPATIESACDTIVAAELIEHLDHPRNLLRTARRLATDDALLMISTQSGPVRETERRVGHRRHFSAEEMRELLKSEGWEPDRVWNAGWPFHDLSKWWANRRPDQSMERFGAKPYGLIERGICWSLRQAFRVNSKRRGAQLFAVARPETR